LFAELQSTPDDPTESLFDANTETKEAKSENTLDVKEAVETAQKYLKQEQSDRLAQVQIVVYLSRVQCFNLLIDNTSKILNEDEGITKETSYSYFTCKAQVKENTKVIHGRTVAFRVI
jgi:hypothetical protein